MIRLRLRDPTPLVCRQSPPFGGCRAPRGPGHQLPANRAISRRALAAVCRAGQRNRCSRRSAHDRRSRKSAPCRPAGCRFPRSTIIALNSPLAPTALSPNPGRRPTPGHCPSPGRRGRELCGLAQGKGPSVGRALPIADVSAGSRPLRADWGSRPVKPAWRGRQRRTGLFDRPEEAPQRGRDGPKAVHLLGHRGAGVLQRAVPCPSTGASGWWTSMKRPSGSRLMMPVSTPWARTSRSCCCRPRQMPVGDVVGQRGHDQHADPAGPGHRVEADVQLARATTSLPPEISSTT